MQRFLLALAFFLLPQLAFAQLQFQTVTACGGLNLGIGLLGVGYMDKTGNLCTNATGGGGGGGGIVTQGALDVTAAPWQVKLYQGSTAVDATHGVYVQPGTAVTWTLANTGFNALQGGTANASGNPFYFDTPASGNLYGAITSGIPAQTSGAAVPIGGIKNCDGASTANPLTPCQAIKGASGVPVLSDPAAMVSLSPTSDYHHYSVATSGGDTQLVGSAGIHVIYSLSVFQTTTTAMEVKMYDSATAPTCSSGTGLIANYPAQSNAISPGFHLTWPNGKVISAGLAFCIVAMGVPPADTDAGTPAVGLVVNLSYK